MRRAFVLCERGSESCRAIMALLVSVFQGCCAMQPFHFPREFVPFFVVSVAVVYVCPGIIFIIHHLSFVLRLSSSFLSHYCSKVIVKLHSGYVVNIVYHGRFL